MYVMRKRFMLLVAAGLLAIAFWGCSKENNGTADKEAEEQTAGRKLKMRNYIVLVNSSAITEQELEKEVDRMAQQVAGRVDPAQLSSMRWQYRRQAVEHLINRSLLLTEADKAGIEVTKEEMYTRLSTVIEGFESEEAFNNRLKELNMTRKELQDELAVGIKIELFIDSKIPMDQPITEAEMNKFYEDNRRNFEHGERVRASHILLRSDQSDSEEAKAEKRAKLEQLLIEIVGGADFGAVAHEHSDCPSKKNDGDLGYFERGRMVPEFEQAAFSLGTGEVSDIVETPFGFHIIKVTEHQEARLVPFDEAQEDIQREINRLKREESIGDFINELRSTAKIEYADSSLIPNE